MIAEDVRCHCQECPTITVGLDAAIAHMETDHGYQPEERWPDGRPVIDTSDVPELLLGGIDG